jgi:hypothetical protein
MIMLEFDRAYVLVGLIYAVLGMLLGLYMGIIGDNTLLTVHVAFLLPGFVTLAIYGMVFRLWPALKTDRLAPAQFWLGTIRSLLLIVGTYSSPSAAACRSPPPPP